MSCRYKYESRSENQSFSFIRKGHNAIYGVNRTFIVSSWCNVHQVFESKSTPDLNACYS